MFAVIIILKFFEYILTKFKIKTFIIENVLHVTLSLTYEGQITVLKQYVILLRDPAFERYKKVLKLNLLFF